MKQLQELRKRVIKANQLYSELRSTVHIPDEEPYQREGIKILSDPFVNGVFTLAVIGQMSAGKSAFINALLEDEDLLPTGHFQTTCALTEILWTEPERSVLRITYGDGHIQEFRDNIPAELKKAVAIPEKFHSIPINHIDQCLLDGWGIEKILSHKTDIEKLSKGRLDENLVKDYVLGNEKEGIAAKTKSTIPVHVHLEYPLSDSYRGWRIVDTPGIGARGGIDLCTKDFLIKNKVDAAIFVFSGTSNIESEDLYQTVSNAYTQLTDTAKKRTFFVITHAGKKVCHEQIDGIFERALGAFSDGEVAITKDRFFAVDSMLSLLYDIAIKKHKVDPMIFDSRGIKLDIMTSAEIDEYRSMIVFLLDLLHHEGKELNTETLIDKIVEIAGFDVLKKALGDFARDTKLLAYKELLETIFRDLEAFGSKKLEDIALWSSKMTKTPEEFDKELKEKEKEINAYRIRIIKEYNEIVLKYGIGVLETRVNTSKTKFFRKVSNAKSIADIEPAYNSFLEMFPLERDSIMKDFLLDCKKLGEIKVSNILPDLVLPPIDLEAARKKAEKEATTTESYFVRIQKKGFINWLRWNIFRGNLGGFDYEKRYRDVIDDDKQLEYYVAHIKEDVNESIKAFCRAMFENYVSPTAINIQQQLDSLVEHKKKEYDAIKASLVSAQDIEKKIVGLEKDYKTICDRKHKLNELKIN